MARDVHSCCPFAQLFLRHLPRSRRELCADLGWSTRSALEIRLCRAAHRTRRVAEDVWEIASTLVARRHAKSE